MKTLVNLNLSKITVPELIENGRHYVTCIGTNAATFPTPNPTLANVTTGITNLETAYNNALNGGTQLTSIMHDKKLIAENLLTQLAHFVEFTANGSETTVLLAGMNIRKKGGRKASIFSVKASPLPLSLELHAPYLPRHAFIWQMAEDNPSETAIAPAPIHTWEQAGISYKGTFTVTGLTPGMKYWFRYATVGKDGQSVWSDPISKIVAE